MTLEIGNKAPLFALKNEKNEEISLADLKGKNVVLYFYPKDDTPGCTIEAQDFTKKFKDFEKLNTIILGVSKDNCASHNKFIEKYKLSFSLLVDEEVELCNKYGVIKEKSMFGKKYLGIDRSTFLINKMGKISQIWRSVKVKGHVDEVLKELKSIEAPS
jgi:thioredoxin-dependent peroxiredoxin